MSVVRVLDRLSHAWNLRDTIFFIGVLHTHVKDILC